MNVAKIGGALRVTKNHLRSKANPDAENTAEIIDPTDYIPTKAYVKFMQQVIELKAALTEAISNAKSGLDFDIDAAVEANKLRQSAHKALKRTIAVNKPYERTEQSSDYKFNVEGNQVTYYYDVDITAVEMFDKKWLRDVTRELISEADAVSAKIDMAMVNTLVDFTPVFDVNDSFDDIISEFVETEPEE